MKAPPRAIAEKRGVMLDQVETRLQHKAEMRSRVHNLSTPPPMIQSEPALCLLMEYEPPDMKRVAAQGLVAAAAASKDPDVHYYAGVAPGQVGLSIVHCHVHVHVNTCGT